ncbi:MAG: hypothetical protein WAO00_11280 [Chthoniobacterales bacterium]
MTVAKWTVSLALVAAAGSIVLVCALTDVRQLIRERYPSAEVTVHEGHSPGVRPVLSTMRLLRGSHFVSENEWVELELTDEPKPVDLASIFQFKVIWIKLTRCIVNDISPLTRQKPGVYAEFFGCDLSALPAEQRAVLRVSPDSSQRLTYGAP